MDTDETDATGSQQQHPRAGDEESGTEDLRLLAESARDFAMIFTNTRM